METQIQPRSWWRKYFIIEIVIGVLLLLYLGWCCWYFISFRNRTVKNYFKDKNYYAISFSHELSLADYADIPNSICPDYGLSIFEKTLSIPIEKPDNYSGPKVNMLGTSANGDLTYLSVEDKDRLYLQEIYMINSSTKMFVKKVENNLIPFLENYNYCDRDADCEIRYDVCAYGAFNKYLHMGSCECGLTYYPEESKGMEELTNSYCNAECQSVRITYGSTKCIKNTCRAVDRKIECKNFKVCFNPEIPVNEYWDWGKVNDLHLFINNTDKNVIYALDDAGKIAWTIWGKDYGFKSFEIRKVQDKLLITNMSDDKQGRQQMTLWVFGGNGKLTWEYIFKGYLDMPQMKIVGKKLILSNGYIITESSFREQSLAELRAFDLDTGKILWQNTSPKLHGTYSQILDNNKLLLWSGGVGRGRLKFRYIISSNNGLIEKHAINVNDIEYGQDKKSLILDPQKKIIGLSKDPFLLYSYLTTTSPTFIWSLSANSDIYKLINGYPYDVKTLIKGDIILSQLYLSPNNIIGYGFKKNNGKMLWKKNWGFVKGGYHIDSSRTQDADGVLVLALEKEHGFAFWGVNEKTGNIIWKYTAVVAGPPPWVGYVDIKDGAVRIEESYESGSSTYKYLNVLTGKEVYK